VVQSEVLLRVYSVEKGAVQQGENDFDLMMRRLIDRFAAGFMRWDGAVRGSVGSFC